MESLDLNFEISQINKKVTALAEKFNELECLMNPEKELWDKQDMLKKWHISERTLAGWRAKGVIDYVQTGKKIWYPKSARESFMNKNLITKKNVYVDRG